MKKVGKEKSALKLANVVTTTLQKQVEKFNQFALEY
jgi:hypothetical protein